MNTNRTHGWALAAISFLWAGHAEAQPDVNVQPKRDNPVAAGFRQVARVPFSVRVKAPDETLLQNRAVSIQFSTRNYYNYGFGSQRTDAGGVVRVGDVEVGLYSVYVRADGVGAVYRNNVEVQAGQNAPFEIQLQTGGALKLTLHESEGRKLALGGAQAHLGYYLPNEIEAKPQERVGIGRRATLQAAVASTRDGDGAAVLENLYPGRYQLRVEGTQGFAPLTQDVEIKAGETTTLSLSAARQMLVALQVKVLQENGEPLRNEVLRFSLRPSSNEAMFARPMYGFGIGWPVENSPFENFDRTAKTDENGVSTLYPITPGSYRLSSSPMMLRNGVVLGEVSNWLIVQSEVIVPAEGGEVVIKAHQRRVPRVNGAP